jgi:hypothetical protein
MLFVRTGRIKMRAQTHLPNRMPDERLAQKICGWPSAQADALYQV